MDGLWTANDQNIQIYMHETGNENGIKWINVENIVTHFIKLLLVSSSVSLFFLRFNFRHCILTLFSTLLRTIFAFWFEIFFGFLHLLRLILYFLHSACCSPFLNKFWFFSMDFILLFAHFVILFIRLSVGLDSLLSKTHFL